MSTVTADTFERHERRFHAVLPYIALAASCLLTVGVEWERPGRIALLLALGAAAGAWLLWRFTLPHQRSRTVPGVRLSWVVLVALMLPLVVLAPWFGFFTFTGYFLIDTLPGRGWMIGGVVSVATLSATSQSGGAPGDDLGWWAVWALLVAFNVGIGGLLMWFAVMTERQRQEHKRTIAELERTVAEKEALQTQLVVQAREAGVLDERGRMAREIHDTLAQGLTGIVTQLEAASTADDAGRARHVDAAMRLARESLTEARRSVDALRPEPLEDAQLPDALAGVARDWSELHGVEVRVTTTGEARPLRPEVEVALLRTAQEALANVAKHAGATRVGLTLSYMDDVVTLDVRDDGVGFAPDEVSGDGFGLTSMRQRLDGLAGTLQVESEPGAGTAVSALVVR